MGGDIPSRTDHSMSREEFDSFFPVEFWREVVDRINNEMPQTLLLAEAFWLMEGYFVRTLGMHRVYNSAFMHMMMKEENGKYRELIYNTLEFEPEILKRYVNFMSNPDEETAIEQYGTDDKYFGVLTLMVTLPGLPMFAHGQIEGYTEKYGMEYKRAYYDEQPKEWLVDRHEREIFPITRKRYLFSEVENFWFYDFYDLNGNLNDNVFIYSNNFGEEKSLVLYNNKYDKAYGNFQKSTPKLVKIDSNNKFIKELNITEALGINGSDNKYYIFTDMVTKLEYIFRGSDLWQNGFYFELNGFERRVYSDIKEVEDNNGEYYQVYSELSGRGVYSIEEMIEDRRLFPLYDTFTKLLSEDNIQTIIDNGVDGSKKKNNSELENFIAEVSKETRIEISAEKIETKIKSNSEIIEKVNALIKKEFLSKEIIPKELDNYFIMNPFASTNENMKIFFAWLILKEVKSQIDDVNISQKIISKTLANSFKAIITNDDIAFEKSVLVEILLEDFDVIEERQKVKETKLSKRKDISDYFLNSSAEFIRKIFEDNYVHKYLKVNLYKDVRYFNRERFEEFVKWLLNIFMFEKVFNEAKPKEILHLYFDLFKYLIESAEESDYKLDELEDILIHQDIE
jgi:hypothetical protein